MSKADYMKNHYTDTPSNKSLNRPLSSVPNGTEGSSNKNLNDLDAKREAWRKSEAEAEARFALEDGAQLPPAIAKPTEPLTAEQIARATDAMNFALVAFRVPENYRAYLDATIGASLGSTDWFEAADIEVGQRAKEVSSQGLKQKTIEKWTQRQRDDFAEWQTAWRVTLIETMPGGKAQGKNIKTRYRLKNLFEVALEVDRRARFIPGYDKNPKRALRKAAAAIYTEFSARLKDPPKRERFRRPTQNSDTCLTLINTYIQKYVGLALLENRNLDAGLEGISLKIDRIRELLKNSTAPIENSTQIAQILQDTRISGWTKMSTQNSLHLLPADALNSPDRLPDAPPENQQFVHTLNEEYGQEIEAPEAPAEPPPAPETMKPQDSRAFRGSPVTYSGSDGAPAKHDRTPPAPPIEAIGPAPAPPADKTTVKMTGVFEAADLEAGAVRKSRVQRLKPAASKALEADEAAACENLKRNHPELLALKAFESRGGDAIEWFFLAPSGKRSGEYHRCTIDEYFDLLWGGLMREAERLGVSLVARVRGGYNIEFDDCDPATVKLLRPFGFLDYETSEANSHCWIGLKDAEDREAVRDRLFARLKEIGSPANPGASGSTRWPGSINFKPGRNLFRVRIGHVALGRFTTPAELEEAGLLAISRPTPSPPPRPPILINAGDDWPNYQQCIEHQTKKGKEHPGLADALFVHRAFLRRHTAQEIAEMLMRISPKAKERGREYVDRTIANSLKHLKKEGWIINDS